MDKEKIKRDIRDLLTWRNYFGVDEIIDALILVDKKFLSKVKGVQSILNTEYKKIVIVIDEATDEEARKIAGKFKKPKIDFFTL